MGRGLLGLVRFGAVALGLGGIASAQTTGTILGVVTDASTGKPIAGAQVVATSPELQGEQTATTDEGGHYRLMLLPVGEYRLAVQARGYQPAERGDIRLSADKTLRADLVATPEAVQLEEQEIRTGLPPVVDVGSAEAGSVISRDFVAGVPVGRTFMDLAETVPQSTGDPFGAGFSGAQSPENAYVLDGLNVTDPVNGRASRGGAPTLLSNFIQEVDVKTGSFLPEYGRSTGGIVNVVTRSGSNEFHGSVFSNLRPDFLVTPNGAVEGNDGEAVAWFTKPSEGSYNLDFGGEIGGPIARDRLWFYAGFAPIITRTYYDRFQRLNVLLRDPGYPDQTTCNNSGFLAFDNADTRCRDQNGFALWNKVPGSDRIASETATSYQWAGKLTFLLDANNTVSVATYGQPGARTLPSFMEPQGDNASYRQSQASYDVVGHYAGKFLDRHLVVEVDAGWHGQRIHPEPNAYQASRPSVEWRDPASYYGLTAFEAVGGPGCAELARCPVSGYYTGGSGGYGDQVIDRFAGKASVSWLFGALGAHIVKAGVDLEHNRFVVDKRLSGGAVFTARGGQFRGESLGYLANGSDTSDLSQVFPASTVHSSAYSNNFSYFLQDSWQVLDTGLTVNGGVRLDTQYIANRANPVDRLAIDDSWGPRVQAIWDFTGSGRGKVSASWGRFFWAIPLHMGDVSFGRSTSFKFREPFGCLQLPQTQDTRYFPGGQVYGQFDTGQLMDPTSGLPACSTLTAFGSPPAYFHQYAQPTTPVMPGLDGTAVDMFGGQLEYEVLPDLSVGFEYTGRRLASLVEDLSPDNGLHFFIANPGRNVTWDYGGATYSAADAVTYDAVTGRTITVKFPKPERSYDGFTVRMTKSFSGHWLAQASYTYSVLRGNYSGPYLVDFGQLGAGVGAAYDLPTQLYNTTGYLPGDHTHSVKIFGSYTWNASPALDVTGGLGYSGWSGRPMNALGAGENDYGPGFAYIIQQGFAGRTPFTHQLDLRLALAWAFSPPYQLRLTVDAFNVLNRKTVDGYDQNYTFDVVQVIQKPGCKGDFVGTPDPVGKLQAACPDVKYLRTADGRPIGVNPGWGKPTGHQGPIQLRFGLALAF